tara:strand:+ start:36 stop:464 length:429 start_codon:yes stop_codon:yes gene_type:complete
MIRFFISLILVIFLSNCSNQTIYSGKIVDQDTFKNLNFVDKSNLINNFGQPSYVDLVSQKYFYYSKKVQRSSIFKENVDYSYIFVFEFDQNDKIISSKVFDLKKTNAVDLIKKETKNDIVRRGLLEKIFGGVGPQRELSTPQ